MANVDDDGQAPGPGGLPETPVAAAALIRLCRAARTLAEDGVVDVMDLVDDYRAIRPLGHPAAHEARLCTDFVAACAALGGHALLGADRIAASSGAPHPPPAAAPFAGGIELTSPAADDVAANALAVALGLACEGRKVLRALGDEPSFVDDLGAACARLGVDPMHLVAALGGDEAQAREAIASLWHGGAARSVSSAPTDDPSLPGGLVDDEALRAACAGRPVYVAAGATERLHDVLSPFARRAHPRLAELGRALGAAPSPDDVYAALDALFAAEPRTPDERAATDADHGLLVVGAATVVRFDALDDGAVDPRARAAVKALAGAGAVLVLCGRDAASLSRVLDVVGGATRAVVALADGFAESPCFPDVVVDATTGYALVVDNALAKGEPGAVSVTLPSLGLTPGVAAGQPVGARETTLFPLLARTYAARARKALPPTTKIAAAVVPIGDFVAPTTIALAVLARMAPAPPAPAPTTKLVPKRR